MSEFPMPKCRYVTTLYVHNEFVSFLNSCSYLLGVQTANVTNLSASTISHSGNLNASIINVCLITKLSYINSGLNQNLTIISTKLNLNLMKNVCFLLDLYVITMGYAPTLSFTGWGLHRM